MLTPVTATPDAPHRLIRSGTGASRRHAETQGGRTDGRGCCRRHRSRVAHAVVAQAAYLVAPEPEASDR